LALLGGARLLFLNERDFVPFTGSAEHSISVPRLILD
jgi:hypothetical protein